MISREDTNKRKISLILFILFLGIVFLCSSCTIETEQIDFDSYKQENVENELLTILGQWYVAECVGKSTEYHDIGIKTDEQEMEEKRIDSETKENYLKKNFDINSEKVKFFYPPTEMGYYCLDWDELFTIYRQPSDIWEGISPPFLCISIQHEDFKDSLNFIVDDNGNATLYVKGLFFKLERES